MPNTVPSWSNAGPAPAREPAGPWLGVAIAEFALAVSFAGYTMVCALIRLWLNSENPARYHGVPFWVVGAFAWPLLGLALPCLLFFAPGVRTARRGVRLCVPFTGLLIGAVAAILPALP